jgi:DNA-binding LacI/PurR family transcriptional regulator
MALKPTSFDIAQLAGVSQPTVSRALRGSPTVSESTRKRIEAIARQLNYKVDKNASSLRSGQSNTLALLIFADPTPDDSMINPFFSTMLGSITRATARRGFDLLVSFQQLSGDWHVDYEDSHKADGIILLGYGDYVDYQPRLAQLERQQTHFVMWGSANYGPAGTIGTDNVRGGREATRHLLTRGRRRIAFIGTANDHCPEILDRFEGYRLAHADLAVAIDPRLHVEARTVESEGYEAAQTLLGRDIAFDGVFAASDIVAIGAMRALREAGRDIPADVAIVGFDDIPAAALADPPLTTISQDAGSAGEALVDALVRRIRGEPVRNIQLPGVLVVRRSCGQAHSGKNAPIA